MQFLQLHQSFKADSSTGKLSLKPIIEKGHAFSTSPLILAVSLALAACGGGGSGVSSDPAMAAPVGNSSPAAAQSTPATPTAQSGVAAPSPSGDSLAPRVDLLSIPKPSSGFASDRVQATSEQPSGPGDIGSFRTTCAPSHMLFDDPIVYPGQPGKSHLHVFFGNTAANGNSTVASIAGTGNSTCRGGTVNRSAYWVPAMIDTRTGGPVVPDDLGVYYKTGYNGIAPSAVNAFPAGLRMIAGDGKNAAPGGPSRYKCASSFSLFNGPSLDGAERCPVGDTVIAEIFFPQCWDGVNLDSPDHKSHMAYPSGGKCPATHPVPMPEITFNVAYKVKEAGATKFWRLSSDNYAGPAGYSAHGDWFNGWKEDAMSAFVTRCNNAARDCHSHLLGDGRMIF